MSRRKIVLKEFTVGWVCALPIELAAAQEILDERYQDLSYQDANDTNLYTLGRIGIHNVVIACLPAGQLGTSSAAVIATRMKSTFTAIRFGLMVGIGGGVPSDQADIRLGDVVISQPTKQNGGVVQYDMGKVTPRICERTGSLNSPPEILLNAVSKLKTNELRGMSNLASRLSILNSSSVFTSENAGPDILFESTYEHLGGDRCERCDIDREIRRKAYKHREIAINYGTIASGNQVMRDGQLRDQVSRALGGVLCFEMEAAGLMNSFPCLVIRGICDYADSHKNKKWQPYASAAAAMCAKEILSIIPETEVKETQRAHGAFLSEFLRSTVDGVDLYPLLEVLSDKDHGQQIPKITIDSQQQRFHWVSKNIDFKHWVQSSHPQVLWLSGPPECGLYEVSSHIARPENAVWTPSGALRFFCSLKKGDMTSAKFVRRLLFQIIYRASTRQISIIKGFLHTLRERLVKRRERDAERRVVPKSISEWHHKLDTVFKDDDPPHEVIKQMLDEASAAEHWAALQAALDIEQDLEMLIVIDGLDDVEDHRDEFKGGLRGFVDYLLGRTTTAKVLLTSRPRADLKEVFAGLPCIEYDKERKDCLASLHFDNSRYGRISEEHEGSLKWIWTHAQCLKWLAADSSRLLYLQGKPGSGKSTLTKYFTKFLLEREQSVKSAILATFFYSWREGDVQRSHYNMLRSILYSILDQHEAFFYHHFQSEYRRQLAESDSCDGGLVSWDYLSLKTLLSSLRDYAEQERFYLIIDAVDESDDKDRREILDLLLSICSQTKICSVKVFIASRPVAALERRISEFHSFIRLQDETQSDILQFASAFLQRVDFPQFVDQARKYVVENANGVFLWVKLVGEELLAYDEQGCAEEDIFEFLKSLPTELDELYQRMLDKMTVRTEKEHRDGVKMFRFVLFAGRPLSVCELLHALGIPDDPRTEFLASEELFQRRIPHERRIVHCGGNFLEIKQHNGNWASSSSGKATVQAMHQTVREFFLRPNGCVAMSKFKMVGEDAHVSMAITCIRYLMLCTANMATRPSDVRNWKLDDFVSCVHYINQRPLASYALTYLKYHLDRCQGDPYVRRLKSQFIDELIRTSDGAGYLLERWARSQLRKTLLSDQANRIAETFRDKTLSTAVKNGFSEATEVLALAGTNVQLKDKNGRTLLLLAAAAGHKAVVHILLEYQADPDTTDKDGRTPLSWAAGNGHETVVRALLERTSYIGPEKDGATPLCWASSNGHESVVRLLLDNGADPNVVDNNGWTSLGKATKNGHATTVVLLLQKSTNIDMRNKAGRTALNLAARSGHEAVVRLLLRFGADANTKDKAGLTALYWATRNRHKSVVQLLLEHEHEGVIDTMDKDGCTALIWAARNKEKETVGRQR
ncbi:ankyrin repeat domain-containing 50 [Fusarium acutatum]|uniref:Ankyrin repeat domain-containing 50 n=1 Tax=Fusarium acutatum TaxID=78861 RepID=A0A8H4K3U8_9HYPO|nr:ankyrin repeat domain-containing 50 [Fusarium acutatum]